MIDTETCEPEAAAPARIIVRYDNRKLYDSRTSRYVTNKALLAMVQAGETIRVVDRLRDHTLTTQVLCQMLHQLSKRGCAFDNDKLLAMLKQAPTLEMAS